LHNGRFFSVILVQTVRQELTTWTLNRGRQRITKRNVDFEVVFDCTLMDKCVHGVYNVHVDV